MGSPIPLAPPGSQGPALSSGNSLPSCAPGSHLGPLRTARDLTEKPPAWLPCTDPQAWIQGKVLEWMLGHLAIHLEEEKLGSASFLFFYKFIYLFMAVLGLRCCVWAFSSCG